MSGFGFFQNWLVYGLGLLGVSLILGLGCFRFQGMDVSYGFSGF